jgi:hypothetical protein
VQNSSLEDNILTATTPYYKNSTGSPAIGNNWWAPGDGEWRPFNGIIDELRIYDRALSPDEIAELAGGAPANEPPVADAGGPYSGPAGEEIMFDACGSFDPDGSVVRYRWDWTNDGVWDTDWLSDSTATHVYNAEFQGQALLQVGDNGCAKDIDTAVVDVHENQPPVCDAGGP